MVEKIYKKVIYALARVAVKYIEHKKKRQQNKSVNYINSTKPESDIEYNKKAIADNIPVEDISSVTNINDIDDSIFLGQKKDIDIIDLGKDTESDEAETKPMTNEDRLDMLLSQMMPPSNSAAMANLTETADSVDTTNPMETIDSVGVANLTETVDSADAVNLTETVETADAVNPTKIVNSIDTAGHEASNEYKDTNKQKEIDRATDSFETSLSDNLAADAVKLDESTEVSDKLHNVNNDEYIDLETKIVEKTESFESEKNAKADFEILKNDNADDKTDSESDDKTYNDNTNNDENEKYSYRSIMTDDYDRYSEELGIKALRQELRRVKYNSKFAGTLFNTVGTLLVVAAIAVLVANLWLPILQVTGTSMSPTLEEGQVLMASKGNTFKTGDVIAFYLNNKILVKRVIAMPGDWVNISDDGTVYVNDIALDEPYLKEKSLGDCNIDLPYQVPESKIFVMGDNRSVSLDSRNTAIGCISEEQVVGKVTLGLWPLTKIGKID